MTFYKTIGLLFWLFFVAAWVMQFSRWWMLRQSAQRVDAPKLNPFRLNDEIHSMSLTADDRRYRLDQRLQWIVHRLWLASGILALFEIIGYVA